jgi:hypothetical protein
MNPLHKLGKKINKVFTGGGGRRYSQSGIGEDHNGLQAEDSQHTAAGDANTRQAGSPQPGHHDENKGFMNNISNGFENFLEAVVGNPRPLPVRTSVPEGEEDDENHKADDKAAPPQPDVTLDANTPVEVLLARIDFLETTLRGETARTQGLEEQLSELQERCAEMERVIHTSLLSKILRPFRICFGGGNQPAQPTRHHSNFSSSVPVSRGY